MKQLPLEKQYESLQHLHISGFGYELIREVLLPDLLGKETPNILYWAGKNLARRYPLETFDDVMSFFDKAGWGTLTVINERNDELEIELTGELVTTRLALNEECTFQLEAGFLAQQIEQQKHCVAEAYEQPKKRTKKVVFTVKWDRKDEVMK
ncbi:YslB family protein [Thermaerobacillus caldiproteolyticus]|uniref:YslB family protein n=1 Tax=Thermaerobacillus caldiproteolyticus TaxID=247480 RepID=UPI00188D45F5|nr:YslB family protein [Anoxybacillus caldiproteolyticus]QPA30283.1 YslB family protein [Anoxybacillus caldiproteolyticus]